MADILDDDPLLNKAKHKNKRNMAWYSLISIIAVTFALLFLVDPDVAERYENMIATLYVVLGGVIASYMGATTWDSINYQKVKNQ